MLICQHKNADRKRQCDFRNAHPNCFASGVRKTLQAYTAPNAICKKTPAVAMTPTIHTSHSSHTNGFIRSTWNALPKKFFPPRLEQGVYSDKPATQILAPNLFRLPAGWEAFPLFLACCMASGSASAKPSNRSGSISRAF